MEHRPVYSFQLQCPVSAAEQLSAELWDYGIDALGESAEHAGMVTLTAGLSSEANRQAMLQRFAAYTPVWQQETRDWESEVKAAWPGRAVGQRLWLAPPWLAPPWSNAPTPEGRLRIVHNPGLASGTGEHPCTRLCLAALERLVTPSDTVLDIGTGSGILAIAAEKLGAAHVVALEHDAAALAVARENASLNASFIQLIHGSASDLPPALGTLTVANIAGTVLLHLWDDLVRITRPAGTLILSGFSVDEAATFARLAHLRAQTVEDEWTCLVYQLGVG